MKKQLSVVILAFFASCIGCTDKSSLPDKGVPFIDPDYGTTIVRISDKNIDVYEGNGIQNEYAKADAYNSDSSRIMLRSNDGHWYLYDAADYSLFRDMSSMVGLQEPEPRWHTSNPDIFYYLYDTKLMQYDVAAAQHGIVHDFKTDFPESSIITTGSEGDASRDRRYWCFMVTDEMFNLQLVCVYDMVDDVVVGTRTAFPDAVNFTTMDASGSHALIGYDSLPFQSFYPDFSHAVDFVQGAAGHGDAAFSANGRDVMVYQNVANDYICMTDLETGAETKLLEIPFSQNTDIGLHVSGNCYAKPGWVLVSTYGAKNTRSGESATWMDHLLFMLELKENPRIIKLAGTHAYTALYPDAVEKNYFAEAFAAVNTAGTRIIFGSNWGVLFPRDYSDAYEVRLPDGWNASQ